MKKLILAAAAVILCLNLSAQDFLRHSFPHQGLDREYWLYLPEKVDASTPLVFMLHGYGGTAEGYRPEMLETARRHGFALCVPDGWPAPLTGKKGWNVRYPKQEGQVSDDEAFVMDLVSALQSEYGFVPARTFLSGMSNGGEMCYIFAWRHPGVFRAIASVAGLTMKWLVDENPAPGVATPFMEIHGTGDHTSEWTGDLKGEFGWGEYLAVPDAVAHVASFAGCTCEQVSLLPYLSSSSNAVILHRYLGGEAEVRLYEVVGGKHSWALKDIDTTEEIWSFLSLYL